MTGGFNITSGEPIDSRMYVADIAHILLDSNWSTVKPYPGLIVSAPDGQVRVFAPAEGQTYKDEKAWIKIGGGGASVAQFTVGADGKIAEAEEAGQVIYVTTGTEAYPAGAYIVTGVGVVAKIGTVKVDEDVAGLVSAVEGRVATLESEMDTVEGNLSTHIEGYNKHLEAFEELSTTVSENGTALGLVEGKVDAIEKTYVKSVNGVEPVNGAVTLTYESVLAENVTNAPTTGAVHTAIEGIKTNYAISASTEKTTEGYAKSYTISQGTTEIVTIDIPKDLVVQSGEVIVATEADKAFDENVVVGDEYIKLTIKDGSTPLYIAAKSLVDTYVSGTADYITIDGYTISLNIANVISHTDEELGKLVVAEGGKTLSTLVKKNKDDITTLNGNLNVSGSIPNKVFKIIDTLVEGVEMGGSKNALYHIARKALSALQEVKSGNENQLTVAEDENDSTIITLTPVTVSSDELAKIGTKDEVAGSTEKLLTAGVAKKYIDDKWDWEVIA